MRRIVGIVGFALSIQVLLLAQRVTFDLCQLTISVRATDGREPKSPVQVEVLAPSGTSVGTAQTNENGAAYFQLPSGVTYVARVSGREIEPATAQFTILGGQQIHNENITIRRISSATKGASTAGTISVAEMNIPKKAKNEMEKGLNAFDHGDYAKARKSFEKAISIYPQYARAYNNLGILALKSRDVSAARELFERSIQTDRDYSPAYVHLARLDIQAKRFTEAKSLLLQALLLNPSFPEAVALLADAEYENKEYAKALADAQRVHTFPEHHKLANTHLLAAQILEILHRNREAIEEYRTFLREVPDSPQQEPVRNAIADLERAMR